jgi:hypothetical protein
MTWLPTGQAAGRQHQSTGALSRPSSPIRPRQDGGWVAYVTSAAGRSDHERDLDDLRLGRPVEQSAVGVRGDQERFGVARQAADLLAAFGDRPQPTDRGVPAHARILPLRPRPPLSASTRAGRSPSTAAT